MLIAVQEQTLPSSRIPSGALLYKVPLLSSEEGLSVPGRGREEIRLWPIVTGRQPTLALSQALAEGD